MNIEDDEAVRSSARPKAPTEKIIEYCRELLERDFVAAKRACAKQVIRIQSALADEIEISALQQERGKLEAQMDDFANAHTVLYDTLKSEDKRIEQDSRYDAINSGNREAFRSLNEKISALNRSQGDDHSSIYSSRSRHSRSSKSSKQSMASNSSQQKRAEMAAKAACLEAELRFHDVESEKVATLKKQDDIKKLQILKELAATQAEMDAVSKVEVENHGFVSHSKQKALPKDDCSEDRLESYLQAQLDSTLQEPTATCLFPTTDTGPSISVTNAHASVTFASGSNLPKLHMSTPEEPPYRTQSSSSLNPFTSPFITSGTSPQKPPNKPAPDEKLNPSQPDANIPSASPGEDLVQRLADLLAQRQDRDSLPRPEPETFTGKTLRYPDWVKSFETLIGSKTKKPSERLYYLGKYTTGEAKEAVSGLLSLDNADAYSKAKKILTMHFGNPFIVADAFRKRINDWPKIQANDGQGLRKLSDFLEHCNTAMKTIQYLNVLNDPDENQKIIKKLPSYLVTRWSRVVDDWIAEDEFEDSAVLRTTGKRVKIGFPPFAEFCKFMRREARIACNPVTSPQALKVEEAKDKVYPGRGNYIARERRNFGARIMVTGSSEVRGSTVKNSSPTNARGITCAFCKDNHELDLCEKFLKIALSERKKFAQTNALCWGCLKWGHVYKECRGKKTCRTCNRRHPTSLHDDSVTHHERVPDQCKI